MGERKKVATRLNDQRVTIMISPLLNQEIRKRQAQYIMKKGTTRSFSAELQHVLRAGLRVLK